MKKITSLIISLFLLVYINACAGYKPIFSSKNFKFIIVDHSVQGDAKLGNQIYSKLYNISQLDKNNPNVRSIRVSITVLIDQVATVKNSAGKILEYKIYLNTDFIANDFLTNQEIVNHSFNYNSSYKVYDQHSETIKMKNKTIDDLINITYENLIIKISESITTE